MTKNKTDSRTSPKNSKGEEPKRGDYDDLITTFNVL
jgi:hypothetical protein